MKKYDYLTNITEYQSSRIKMAQYYFSIIDDALDTIVSNDKCKEKAKEKINEGFMWVVKGICDQEEEKLCYEKE